MWLAAYDIVELFLSVDRMLPHGLRVTRADLQREVAEFRAHVKGGAGKGAGCSGDDMAEEHAAGRTNLGRGKPGDGAR